APAHRPGAALLPGLGAGPGDAGQAGAPGPRRPRGVRPARALGRAARRPGPPAGPRHRHRVPRRTRRNRQVGARPVRGPGVGDGAAGAQEGRDLPPAVRRRWSGARLPARRREREDVALGAGGLRHAGRAGLAGGDRRDRLPRADRGAAADPHPRSVAARLVRDRRRGAVARARRAADRAVPAGCGVAGGAHPRRRPAGQPAGRPARRHHRGHRGAQGAPAVRARDADAVGALADRRAGDRDAGGPPLL
ncbi:MAG: Predicted ATPase related to phosphate starvation-inducible protein PhoH, partial [uncultured Blastococcus sp.]